MVMSRVPGKRDANIIFGSIWHTLFRALALYGCEVSKSAVLIASIVLECKMY